MKSELNIEPVKLLAAVIEWRGQFAENDFIVALIIAASAERGALVTEIRALSHLSGGPVSKITDALRTRGLITSELAGLPPPRSNARRYKALPALYTTLSLPMPSEKKTA